jgi:hypothetical protein
MKNLDIGKDVRFIFCDISKAFDRVWHRGLLYKLRKYGIKGNLLTWFGSYLSDRKQRVCMNSNQNSGIQQFHSDHQQYNKGMYRQQIVSCYWKRHQQYH